jgi:hypothetical protein
VRDIARGRPSPTIEREPHGKQPETGDFVEEDDRWPK